jgi:hypothetical protein
MAQIEISARSMEAAAKLALLAAGLWLGWKVYQGVSKAWAGAKRSAEELLNDGAHSVTEAEYAAAPKHGDLTGPSPGETVQDLINLPWPALSSATTTPATLDALRGSGAMVP